MKILLVTDQFFNANNGMTISSRRFASCLAAHGNEVRVVACASPADTPYPMKKMYIPIFNNLVTSQGMTFAKTDHELLRSAVLWADVVHFLTPFMLSHNGIMLCRQLGKPYTAAFHVQPENITSSIHMSKWNFVNGSIYAWFNHYVYRYCPHIHCPSAFIANELVKHGYKSELHIISNGIDPDFKYIKNEKPEELRGRFLILSIGRLSIEKRQDVTIRAIAKSRYRDKITLMLAGQGPRHRQLAALAEKSCVPTDIRFYDKTSLIRLMSYCDLYVHSADAEIEAMSCMEAFACGLVPVIANSAKSATPQFALDEKSLFDAGDSDMLASRIDWWIEHEDERLKFEKKYSDSAAKYQLDSCVCKAEQMFYEAAAEQSITKPSPVTADE
ncbi:MAG: glycosyltransferase [Eubacteriales bacterium]